MDISSSRMLDAFATILPSPKSTGSSSQRLEHVRQKHPHAGDRHQRHTSPWLGRPFAPIRFNSLLCASAPASSSTTPPEGQLAFLRGDHPPSVTSSILPASSRRFLFLLDELLQGTNSRDRLIGAQGIVNSLLNTSAIGLHQHHIDLALTQLTSELIRNMHFQDEIDDGKMKFDFILREGPVTRSNGVALMRLIGLDV